MPSSEAFLLCARAVAGIWRAAIELNENYLF